MPEPIKELEVVDDVNDWVRIGSVRGYSTTHEDLEIRANCASVRMSWPSGVKLAKAIIKMDKQLHPKPIRIKPKTSG